MVDRPVGACEESREDSHLMRFPGSGKHIH